jgi:hypothetical protein
MLTPELLAGSSLKKDDVAALETIAEALFRSDVPEDKAAEAFDRAFGWAEESAAWKAAS